MRSSAKISEEIKLNSAGMRLCKQTAWKSSYTTTKQTVPGRMWYHNLGREACLNGMNQGFYRRAQLRSSNRKESPRASGQNKSHKALSQKMFYESHWSNSVFDRVRRDEQRQRKQNHDQKRLYHFAYCRRVAVPSSSVSTCFVGKTKELSSQLPLPIKRWISSSNPARITTVERSIRKPYIWGRRLNPDWPPKRDWLCSKFSV